MALFTKKDVKQCNHCNLVKPITEFYKNVATPDGRRNECMACESKRNAEYRKIRANRSKITARCILAFGDFQAPAHHPDLIDILTYVKQVYAPDEVVCMGDELDSYNWSSYLKNPDAKGPAAELEEALVVLRQVYELFPKATVLESNHVDERFNAMLARGGVSKRLVMPLSEILEMPQGWRRKFEHISNGIVFRHGHKDGKGMTKAITEDMLNRHDDFYSMVNGHHHSCLGLKCVRRVPKKQIWGAHSGCLVDRKHPFMGYSGGYEAIGLLVIMNGFPTALRPTLDHHWRWTGDIINGWTGQSITNGVE